MKKATVIILSSFVVLATLFAAGFGVQEQRAGDSIVFQKGSVLQINADASAPQVIRRVTLGAPAASSTNAILSSSNLTNGSYTFNATTNAVPRTLTFTVTATGADDAVGNLTVTGTDFNNNDITEVVALSQNSTANGTTAFKKVTKISSTNVVAAGGADKLTVGTGNLLGLPGVVAVGTVNALATANATLAIYPVTRSEDAAKNVVDASAGTYNGTNVFTVYIGY